MAETLRLPLLERKAFRTAGPGSTDSFSGRPLSRASRPFMGSTLRVAFASRASIAVRSVIASKGRKAPASPRRRDACGVRQQHAHVRAEARRENDGVERLRTVSENPTPSGVIRSVAPRTLIAPARTGPRTASVTSMFDSARSSAIPPPELPKPTTSTRLPA